MNTRRAMAEDAPVATRNTVALRGVASDASRVTVLIAPLYADFVHYVDGVHRSIAARPAAHEH